MSRDVFPPPPTPLPSTTSAFLHVFSFTADSLAADYALVASRPTTFQATLVNHWKCADNNSHHRVKVKVHSNDDHPPESLFSSSSESPRPISCILNQQVTPTSFRSNLYKPLPGLKQPALQQMASQPASTAGTGAAANSYRFNTANSSPALTAGLASGFGGQPFVNSSKVNGSTSGASVPQSLLHHPHHPHHPHHHYSQTSHRQQQPSPPSRITDSDAIQLLAEDVESRLEALLRTFIQEEKLRQQARGLLGRRSVSLTSLNQSDPTGDHDQLVGGGPDWSAGHDGDATAGGFHRLMSHSGHSNLNPHGSLNGSPLSGSCSSLNTSGKLFACSPLTGLFQTAPQVNQNGVQAPARHSSHRLGRRSNSVERSSPNTGSSSQRENGATSLQPNSRSTSPTPRQQSNIYSRPKTPSNSSMTSPCTPTSHTTQSTVANHLHNSSSNNASQQHPPGTAYTKNLFGSRPSSSVVESVVPTQQQSTKQISSSPAADFKSSTASTRALKSSRTPSHATPLVNSLTSHLLNQLGAPTPNGPSSTPSSTPSSARPVVCQNGPTNGHSGHDASSLQKTLGNISSTKKSVAQQPHHSSHGVHSASLGLTKAPAASNSQPLSLNTVYAEQPLSRPESGQPLSRRVAAAREQEQRKIRTGRSSSLADANNNLLSTTDRASEARRRSVADGCATYSVVSDTKHKWEQREQGTRNVQQTTDRLHECSQQAAVQHLLSLQQSLSDPPSPSLCDSPALPVPPHVAARPSAPHLPQQSSAGHQHSPQAHHRHNPVKPFLSKGSVAERVLLFEKRPAFTQPGQEGQAQLVGSDPTASGSAVIRPSLEPAVLYSSWKQKEVVNLARNFEQNLRPPATRPSNCWGSGYGIPRFHFPNGKPPTGKQLQERLDKIVAFFAPIADRHLARANAAQLCVACGLPVYWKEPLFSFASGGKSHLSADQFIDFWKKMCHSCHDDASKFVYILSRGRAKHLLAEDFVAMIQDVINSHPGLSFLKDAYEFHSRYVHTVIARIFYCVNRSWSGRITVPELRKSNFLQVVRMLETEEDINQITDYFSYEHFYVIYCKFWELDKDHDLVIDKYDLSRHNDGAISSRMVERIFSGAVTRGQTKKQMTYQEFVFFLISEEDKRQETAVEYWFRCLDLDGDGHLSLFELEYFYEEQVKRMEAIGIEALPFDDCICQMLDMINPTRPDRISLSDLKHCRMTPIFLDTFFNLDKYLDHEQRDPFANKEDQVTSDWDRYASEEYEILVAEENVHNQSL